MGGGRKKPYSGKKKKEQLLKKRAEKREQTPYWDWSVDTSNKRNDGPDLLNIDMNSTDKRIVFKKQSHQDIEIGKAKSKQVMERGHAVSNHVGAPLDHETVLRLKAAGEELGLPTRPVWDSQTSKSDLELLEALAFSKWLEIVESADNINDFEHNLEVWRQLWRTIEFSDVLAIVVDCRYPSHLFPYAILSTFPEIPAVIVLMKTDLVDPEQPKGWSRYFKKLYPDIEVISFAARERVDFDLTRQKRPRPAKTCDGLENLFSSAARALARTRDASEAEGISKCFTFDDHRHKDSEKITSIAASSNEMILTIGTVGSPNAGKSSLVNALMKRSVVSVSATPGHTKHFQTSFVNRTTNDDGEWGWSLQLCDCPGLVFPSTMFPRALQIACGQHLLAQVREPFTAIKYVGEFVETPLAEIYDLLPIDEYQDIDSYKRSGKAERKLLREAHEWSAWDVCVSLAIKKSFLTANAARPDLFRAANFILRDVVDGRIRVSFRAPDEDALQESKANSIDIFEASG